MSADVVQLLLPWRYTPKQLAAMDDETFRAVRPRLTANRASREALVRYWADKKKWDAALRRRAALKSPHANWGARRKGCAVHVLVERSAGRAVKAGEALPHRSRWERVTRSCGRPSVAWDGTDRRRVGYLWGACGQHLAQAMADDPERVWYWHTGAVIDEGFDLDGELALLALAGSG